MKFTVDIHLAIRLHFKSIKFAGHIHAFDVIQRQCKDKSGPERMQIHSVRGKLNLSK